MTETVKISQSTLPIKDYWTGTDMSISKVGEGLVHRTYLVETGVEKFILQEVNTFVFRDIDQLISNYQKVSHHLIQNPVYTLKVPVLIHTRDGHLYTRTDDGSIFRCLSWVDGSTTVKKLRDTAQAFEVARAFGIFSAALSWLKPEELHETIPGFHSPSIRQKQFLYACTHGQEERIKAERNLIDHLWSRRDIAEKIDLLNLPVKIAHNDAKLSNVLFDHWDHPLSIIDLDTVMPGSPLFDFGDLVRSLAASKSEEHPHVEEVFIDADILIAIEQGFLKGAESSLTEIEVRELKWGAAYIIYEQAIRFLADYLLGDPYYKIEYPDQNLVRARNQWKLLQSLLHLIQK